MNSQTIVHDIQTNDYGIDWEGVRRTYVNHKDMQMEVEGGSRPLALTLHHFTGQRRPVDMSKHLAVLADPSFDGAVKLAEVLLLGLPAASVNREGEAA